MKVSLPNETGQKWKKEPREWVSERQKEEKGIVGNENKNVRNEKKKNGGRTIKKINN